MIKNEREYRITKTQAEGFSQALDSPEETPASPGLHPLIAKARKDALESQLADLNQELREYESLKHSTSTPYPTGGANCRTAN